jgi:hypothetical protein
MPQNGQMQPQNYQNYHEYNGQIPVQNYNAQNNILVTNQHAGVAAGMNYTMAQQPTMAYPSQQQLAYNSPQQTHIDPSADINHQVQMEINSLSEILVDYKKNIDQIVYDVDTASQEYNSTTSKAIIDSANLAIAAELLSPKIIQQQQFILAKLQETMQFAKEGEAIIQTKTGITDNEKNMLKGHIDSIHKTYDAFIQISNALKSALMAIHNSATSAMALKSILDPIAAAADAANKAKLSVDSLANEIKKAEDESIK